MHGPLVTLILTEALRLSMPDRKVVRLRHRSTAPLFCGRNANIRVDTNPTSDSARATLRGGNGTPLAHLTTDLVPHALKGATHA